jgi:hypothetical protein
MSTVDLALLINALPNLCRRSQDRSKATRIRAISDIWIRGRKKFAAHLNDVPQLYTPTI